MSAYQSDRGLWWYQHLRLASCPHQSGRDVWWCQCLTLAIMPLPIRQRGMVISVPHTCHHNTNQAERYDGITPSHLPSCPYQSGRDVWWCQSLTLAIMPLPIRQRYMVVSAPHTCHHNTNQAERVGGISALHLPSCAPPIRQRGMVISVPHTCHHNIKQACWFLSAQEWQIWKLVVTALIRWCRSPPSLMQGEAKDAFNIPDRHHLKTWKHGCVFCRQLTQ